MTCLFRRSVSFWTLIFLYAGCLIRTAIQAVFFVHVRIAGCWFL